MMSVDRITSLVRRSGVFAQIAKIGALLVGVGVFMYGVAWIDGGRAVDEPSSGVTSAWTLPSLPQARPQAPLPQGFPTMEFPPPMPVALAGAEQPVPTKYGITYSVPNALEWRASNTAVAGWNDHEGLIMGIGAVSDYGYGYCAEADSDSLGTVGVAGRNGTTPQDAAFEIVSAAERIFGNSAGERPHVDRSGPHHVNINGIEGVRYTAKVRDIPDTPACGPDTAELDVLAVESSISAEVMVLVVEHRTGHPDSLTSETVETIIQSLKKTT